MAKAVTTATVRIPLLRFVYHCYGSYTTATVRIPLICKYYVGLMSKTYWAPGKTVLSAFLDLL